MKKNGSFWEGLLRAAKPIVEIVAKVLVAIRCAIWIVVELLRLLRGPFS